MKRDAISCACIVAFFLLAVFVLNATCPLQGDDMFYSLGVSSVTDAFRQSFVVDGYRPLVHFLTRLFCTLWNPVFAIANTLMMAIFVALVYFYSVGRRFEVARLSMLVCLVVLFYVGDVTVGYIAGSMNYLWPSAGMMAFLLIVRRFDVGVKNWGEYFAWLVAAVIFGWLQETFTMAVGFALAVCFLLGVTKKDTSRARVSSATAG